MSSSLTERFLAHLADTVPLLEEPGEGALISNEELQKSIDSYLTIIREENSGLPAELRLSEEMQLYQARQITVLEFWGVTAHAAFPPLQESEACIYQAATLYRVTNPTFKQLSQLEPISPTIPTEQNLTPQRAPRATTPIISPFRIPFKKPSPSVKTRQYRKPESRREESGNDSIADLSEGRGYHKSITLTSHIPNLHQNPAVSVTKGEYSLSEAPTTSNPPKPTSAAAGSTPKGSNGRNPPTKPLSTVTAAFINRQPVPPVWQDMRPQPQDGWDPLTGFPSGSFVFSTRRAFPRIVGPITDGVAEIINKVNMNFPLLHLKWERTPMKADGRKDLALWVEFETGVSHTDVNALEQRAVMKAGLSEFHQRDVADAQEYLGTFFKRNLERLRMDYGRKSSTNKEQNRRK